MIATESHPAVRMSVENGSRHQPTSTSHGDTQDSRMNGYSERLKRKLDPDLYSKMGTQQPYEHPEEEGSILTDDDLNPVSADWGCPSERQTEERIKLFHLLREQKIERKNRVALVRTESNFLQQGRHPTADESRAIVANISRSSSPEYRTALLSIVGSALSLQKQGLKYEAIEALMLALTISLRWLFLTKTGKPIDGQLGLESLAIRLRTQLLLEKDVYERIVTISKAPRRDEMDEHLDQMRELIFDSTCDL